MDLALYDPEYGYYARAGQRSGRAGDFFTSVDVGPLFGALLAIQLGEMAQLLQRPPVPDTSDPHHESRIPNPGSRRGFALVEAGAGNGRLSADILRAAYEHDRAFYETIQLHLVEASATARAAQLDILRAPERDGLSRATDVEARDGSRRATDVSDRLRSSSAALPHTFEGALVANELLDAMPVHQVVMREDGLREVFVDAARTGLHLKEGPPSTPALQEYLDRAGAHLEPGWRAEINLRAVEWMRDAARRLQRGFVILIDYGHEAHELYSVSHSGGTLTTFSRHQSAGPERTGTPAWLDSPGDQDLTAHVDFTSVRAAAEAEGMTTIALLDQTYFLLGLVTDTWKTRASPQRSNALKTLVMPGGLGSTQKVLILGKAVGVPALKGCSFKVRMT